MCAIDRASDLMAEAKRVYDGMAVGDAYVIDPYKTPLGVIRVLQILASSGWVRQEGNSFVKQASR